MRLAEMSPPYQTSLSDAITQVAEVAPNLNYKCGLLRGSAPKGPLASFTIRQDRRPRDATMISTVIFNYWIEQKLGIPNIRSRSLYATSNYGLAASYGSSVYCLMPPNDALAVYDPDIEDSLIPMRRIDDRVAEIVGKGFTVSDLSVTDPASVSIQKILDSVDDQQQIALRALLSDGRMVDNYIAVKCSQLSIRPEDGTEPPEIMILGVSSVVGFDCKLLQDQYPRLSGSDYIETFVRLVDQELAKNGA